jgi:hypothetical protein
VIINNKKGTRKGAFFNKIHGERMNRSCILLFITSFVVLQPAHAVVILVHGSFSVLATWCKPKGAFFDTLEQQAQLLNHKVVPFSWSGVPTDTEIVRGGQALAKLILSYPPDEEKILIGHSHGGNVIIIASHLLHEACIEQVSYECTSSLIMQAHAKPSSQSASGNLLHDYLPTLRNNKKREEQLRETVIEAINDLKTCTKHYKNYASQKNPVRLIAKVYTLGTPVEPKKYYPNMHVIDTFINFYSTGDFIQPVFGLYKRTYPPHERIANLSIWLEGSGNFIRPNKPAHHELHHPLIGQWILSVPEMLQTKKQGNFERFSCNQNGSLTFKKNAIPSYQIQEHKKSLRTLLVPQALL